MKIRIKNEFDKQIDRKLKMIDKNAGVTSSKITVFGNKIIYDYNFNGPKKFENFEFAVGALVSAIVKAIITAIKFVVSIIFKVLKLLVQTIIKILKSVITYLSLFIGSITKNLSGSIKEDAGKYIISKMLDQETGESHGEDTITSGEGEVNDIGIKSKFNPILLGSLGLVGVGMIFALRKMKKQNVWHNNQNSYKKC